ncbi:protein argonaute-2 isoform X3 [Chelonus insularis]|uniref:protein argonaute-2 isoform X2 n=1 Tax=Chelonus insularis TaxID=460826 RepID=UPI00158C9838|nr:protein argonaute-2 isoform X2 [Chelonus insularis]XP_034935945.1 protein argonaute-2 isoform X3 [Chelonus insularis]
MGKGRKGKKSGGDGGREQDGGNQQQQQPPSSSQQRPQQPRTDQHQQSGPRGQQGSGPQQQSGPRGQQGSGPQQQSGPRGQQGSGQQQSGPRGQQGSGPQQQSAWGQSRQQQPSGPSPPQGSGQQQAAWGQSGQQQPSGPSPPQGSGQQQAAWGQSRQQQPSGPSPPQGSGQQQAAWGKSRQQQPSGPSPPQGSGQQQAARGQSGQQQPSGPSPPQSQKSSLSQSMKKLDIKSGKTHEKQTDKKSPSKSTGSTSTASADTGENLTPIERLMNVKKSKHPLSDADKHKWLSLIPVRKNLNICGTEGRKIRVYTNMVSLIFKSNFKSLVTHYDVKFDPDKPKFIKKLALDAMREKHYPKNWPAFDGRVNLISAGDLPFGYSITDSVEIFDHERQSTRPVTVTLTKANEIDMNWLRNKNYQNDSDGIEISMQVLNIILRSAPSANSISVGRTFFKQPPQRIDLSGGMELYTGIFQSAVMGWKPLYNIDVANKAFPSSINVVELFKELCADRGRVPNEVTADMIKHHYDDISRFITGLKVIYQLPDKPSQKRTVGVNGLDRSARDAVFELDNNEKTTVERYFLGCKHYKLQYPDLPCLWVGSRAKRTLLPPELCSIAPGLVTNRKLSENQTRNMIRNTAKPAYERKQTIDRLFHGTNYNENQTLREFGVSLNGTFEEVDARVLSPPELQYHQQTVKVSKGVWQASKFYSAKEIPSNTWTILNLTRINEDYCRQFANFIKNSGRSNGMNIGELKTPLGHFNPRDRDFLKRVISFLEQKKQENIRLVVVVIPPNPPDIYQKVKQLAELRVGILTQCIKDNTINKIVERNDRATTGNILLKINSKLNGVNHVISAQVKPECLKVPTIIFGADVTHPSPDAEKIPSIAAVTASSSHDVFKYNFELRIQPAREELILDLENIVVKQINIFQRMNGNRKPENIIFYRDGVGDSQFPQLMHFELGAIQKACSRIYNSGEPKPKITFLVVQKRHHIRLFPKDRNNSDDRGGNVQAGTIVDTQITHPSHIDFYLVSHASIQGTARPTKYHCLFNDNPKMSENEIEKLTYHLCHMFSRCNRSVSYPAPTYNAHLAAFRARALIFGVDIPMDNMIEAQKKITIHRDLFDSNPMFFV